MTLRPEDITIAVTVYSRRDYVLQAVASALEQSATVQVMVIEDCGPDPGLQQFVLQTFGSRIRYLRNARNRGLFDNWNACMEYCTTPYLSILHDDDRLHPWFIESMLGLAQAAPDRKLYFGRAAIQDAQDRVHPAPPVSWPKPWRDVDLAELADECVLVFPGNLFRVEDARAVGGVRRFSYFTGDWDLWFRLGVSGGVAQSEKEVSVMRGHYGTDRGSVRVERMGWKWALDNVQRKRNLALLARAKGIRIPFDRTKLLATQPIPRRVLLRYAKGFSPVFLKYNAWLLTQSTPPSLGYAMFQRLVRWLGPQSLRLSSQIWNIARPNH